MRLHSLQHAIRRSPARYFIHRHAHVQAWAAAAGYAIIHDGGSGSGGSWSIAAPMPDDEQRPMRVPRVFTRHGPPVHCSPPCGIARGRTINVRSADARTVTGCAPR